MVLRPGFDRPAGVSGGFWTVRRARTRFSSALGTQKTLSRDSSELGDLGWRCEPINLAKTKPRRSFKTQRPEWSKPSNPREKRSFGGNIQVQRHHNRANSMQHRGTGPADLFSRVQSSGKVHFTPADILRNSILDQNNQILIVLSTNMLV